MTTDVNIQTRLNLFIDTLPPTKTRHQHLIQKQCKQTYYTSMYTHTHTHTHTHIYPCAQTPARAHKHALFVMFLRFMVLKTIPSLVPLTQLEISEVKFHLKREGSQDHLLPSNTYPPLTAPPSSNTLSAPPPTPHTQLTCTKSRQQFPS